MKVMFAGDVHGNEAHLRRLFMYAVEHDVSTIVQAGDFGFWPHEGWGRKFINLASELAQTTLVDLYWIEGNHDNHDVLNAYRKQFYGVPTLVPTPTSAGYYNGFSWIPRGTTFKLGDMTLMGFGGGWSIDWEYRTPGKSWWPDEIITKAEVEALPESKVDVLVTHECPESAPLYTWKESYGDPNSQRKLVLDIVHKTHPDLVICAHHHKRQSLYTFEGVPVEVLGHDEGPFGQSYMVMDVD